MKRYRILEKTYFGDISEHVIYVVQKRQILSGWTDIYKTNTYENAKIKLAEKSNNKKSNNMKQKRKIPYVPKNERAQFEEGMVSILIFLLVFLIFLEFLMLFFILFYNILY